GVGGRRHLNLVLRREPVRQVLAPDQGVESVVIEERVPEEGEDRERDQPGREHGRQRLPGLGHRGGKVVHAAAIAAVCTYDRAVRPTATMDRCSPSTAATARAPSTRWWARST